MKFKFTYLAADSITIWTKSDWGQRNGATAVVIQINSNEQVKTNIDEKSHKLHIYKYKLGKIQ